MVEPTHLKNMLFKLEDFPRDREEKSKKNGNHQLVIFDDSVDNTNSVDAAWSVYIQKKATVTSHDFRNVAFLLVIANGKHI